MDFILLLLLMVLSGYTFTENVAGELLNKKPISISSNDLLHSVLKSSCFPWDQGIRLSNAISISVHLYGLILLSM
jgi:hypothetical protein